MTIAEKRNTCKECPAFYEPCLRSGLGDKPAHLIVVGPAPSGFSVGKQYAFYGRQGRLFKSLLAHVKHLNGNRYADLKTYFTYAAMVGAYEPKAEHLACCRVNLLRELGSIQGINGREPVIVALGPIAVRALGLRIKKIADVVGREMSMPLPTSVGNVVRHLPVIPLLSMKHLETKIGTAGVVMSALFKAVRHAFDPPVVRRTPADIAKNYQVPQTIEEVQKLVDYILDYYNPERDDNPNGWYISLDVETNTLKPYCHPDPKVLMLSVAWDDEKSATILLDHPEVPYDPIEAWKHVKRLLQSPKPKVFHNWKFDRKFLEDLKQIQVNNVQSDTMLGEHFLDEDKKGHYKLKQLVPHYVPEYEGYDDAVKNFLKGKEEAEEKASRDDDEETDAANTVADTVAETVEALVLTDDEVIERHLQLGCPEDRDDTQWTKLVNTLLVSQPKKEEQGVKKKRTKLTVEQKAQAKASTADIKELRKLLNIRKPGKKKKGVEGPDEGFAKVPLGDIVRYAATDSDVTRLILKAQTHRSAQMNTRADANYVMKYLYLPGSRTLSRMEWRGFAVDQAKLDIMMAAAEERSLAAKEVLRSKFDPTLNPNSPKQVMSLMARMNFEAMDGEGLGSTGKLVLEHYEKKYPPDDPRNIFVTKLREFRETDKVWKKDLKKNIKRHSRDDGKIHCSFNLQGSATGRLSSSQPNMQNVKHVAARVVAKGPDGKELKGPDGEEIVIFPGYNIKSLFIPSKPENVIVNLDIKGAELRVYTAYSHDKLFIDALNNGLDAHSLVTSKVHDLPYGEVMARKKSDLTVKKWREDCKKALFCTLYGGGAWRVAQQTGLTKEAAEELQNFIFSSFPDLKAYVETVTKQVRDVQQLKTVFGRYRRFRLAHLSNELMAEANRQAVNFLIQSTSSDLVLSQLCEIDEHLWGELGGQLLITVHDSMTLEMPEKNVDKLFPFMDYWVTQRIKDKFDWLPVPFLFDIAVGPNYGELVPLEHSKKKETDDVQTTQAAGAPA